MSMKKVYRVFISSVGKLLEEERRTLEKEILNAGYIAVNMERFISPNNYPSIDVIKDYLDESDVVVMVLGHLYGNIIEKLCKTDCSLKKCNKCSESPESGCRISYTHFEYLYAIEKDKIIFALIKEGYNNYSIFKEKVENLKITDTNENESIITQYTSRKNDNEQFIKNVVEKFRRSYDGSIADFISKVSLIKSWIKENEIIDNRLVGLIDAKILDENEKLKTELDELKSIKKEEEKKNLSYAIAYIPVRLDQRKPNKIIFLLRHNNKENSEEGKGYSEYSWMFPGKHLYSQNMRTAERDGDKIINFDSVSEFILKNECRDYYGITINYFDSLRNKFVENPFPPETINGAYQQAISPIFDMILPVYDDTTCYKKDGHLVHFDYVYLAKYKSFNPKPAREIREIPIELELGGVSLKDENKNNAIKKIKETVENELKIGTVLNINRPSTFCYESVYEMMRLTLKYLNNNKSCLAALVENSDSIDELKSLDETDRIILKDASTSDNDLISLIETSGGIAIRTDCNDGATVSDITKVYEAISRLELHGLIKANGLEKDHFIITPKGRELARCL